MFVEIITMRLCKPYVSMIAAVLCLALYTIMSPVHPGVQTRVHYLSMCFKFEPGDEVLLEPQPFVSHNLPPGWSISRVTGEIKGIAKAGDMNTIEVAVTKGEEVVNATARNEVAISFGF